MSLFKKEALPRLDKDNAAMLLVDHQVGLFSLVRDSSPADFKNIVIALAETAKLYNLPTVLTTSIEKGPNGVLLPEIPMILPDAAYVERPGQINAWDNEEFVAAVKATGKKQLIVAGIVTEVCVAFPVLSALAEGFDVFVCIDGSGTFSEKTRDMAVTRMVQGGAQMLTWFALIMELHRDWRNDGASLAKICCDHVPEYKAVMDGYNSIVKK